MIERFDVGPRMSEMAVHNGTVYLAGQIADDGTADISGQTEQVLAAIDALLARAGSDKTKILRAQIYLADLNDFSAMNDVWERWVGRSHATASDRTGRTRATRMEDRNRDDCGCLIVCGFFS